MSKYTAPHLMFRCKKEAKKGMPYMKHLFIFIKKLRNMENVILPDCSKYITPREQII